MMPQEADATRLSIELFQENGYAGPFSLLDLDQSCFLERMILAAFRRGQFSVLKTGRNRHLDWKPIADICRLGPIVQHVASLLGSNLLLWRTQIFYQGTDRALPWHRDTFRNLLDGPPKGLSLHVAITSASESNCVSVIPGSHLIDDATPLGLEEDRGKAAYGNTRYRQVGSLPCEKKMVLKRGEFFIFHPMLIHQTSRVNDTAPAPRLALTLRIITPDVKVLPAAFSDVPPSRRGVVVLAGEDTHRLNQAARWPQ